MDISTKGLIEIMSHEGICLSPYLDSVGVWTIGVGITKHDGVDPEHMGPITIDQAIAMFKERIKAYVLPVQKYSLKLTQAQFDALVSFCYNVGPGNLNNLCRNRSVEQIGEAFSLYHKPPEIIARRDAEQKLFKEGVYSSDGKILVFPVNEKHKPVYHKGYTVDVTHHFAEPAKTVEPAKPEPAPAKPKSPKPEEHHDEPQHGSIIIWLIELILGLFK